MLGIISGRLYGFAATELANNGADPFLAYLPGRKGGACKFIFYSKSLNINALSLLASYFPRKPPMDVAGMETLGSIFDSAHTINHRTMSTPFLLDDNARKVVVASLQESWARAQEEKSLAQTEFEAAQKRLERATGELESYAGLLEQMGVSLPHGGTYALSLGAPKVAPKRRETVDVTTLRVVTEGGVFKTVDQVIAMVLDSYGENEIKPKTVKNALWELTNGTGKVMEKTYSKLHKGNLYGLLTWFNEDGTPMKEHMEQVPAAHEATDQAGREPGLFAETKTAPAGAEAD